MQKRLLSLEEVCHLAQCSRATLYRRMKNNSFPKPTKVTSTFPTVSMRGPQSVNAWKDSEVMDWLLAGNDSLWLEERAKDIERVMRTTQNFDEIETTAHGSKILIFSGALIVTAIVLYLIGFNPG